MLVGPKAGGNKNTFNVDDVGYANTSDVNMNAGAFNSYNTDQTWSSGLSGSHLVEVLLKQRLALLMAIKIQEHGGLVQQIQY